MPRTARASVGGLCYHVLNRGNARATVFHKDDDFDAFVHLLAQAQARLPMRVLAYCLLPNHFHLVLWPVQDGDLSAYMGWLMNAHVRRYHQHYHSGGTGHIWQGRFKAFPIQADEHLLAVLRYVERNPLRAGLVPAGRAESWRWSSLPGAAGVPGVQGAPGVPGVAGKPGAPGKRREHAKPGTPGSAGERKAPGVPVYPSEVGDAGAMLEPTLHRGPVPRPANWLARVNQAESDAELAALRRSVARGTPLGGERWVKGAAARLGLMHTLRNRGRPRKEAA